MNTIQLDFSPYQHALLFAWITRGCVQGAGAEKGIEAVRKWIRQYGYERGKRMALRAIANGHSLDWPDYFIYGEWKAPEGESVMRLTAKTPDVINLVQRCPWEGAWREQDLMAYGCLYCQEIDAALASGFNPELRLEVRSTLSNDGKDCEFVFRKGNLSFWNILKMGWRKRKIRNQATVMPWEYHIGHLYASALRVLEEELGSRGLEAVNDGMREFAERFGEASSATIKTYKDVDFSRPA